MASNISEWAKLLSDIYKGDTAVCPECGGKVDAQVYAKDNGVGFALMDCTSCKKHIWLSRIRVPKGFKAKSF